MYVGVPNNIDNFDLFEDNEIKVYVKKGIPCPSGNLTITVGSFLWFEKLIVEGML